MNRRHFLGSVAAGAGTSRLLGQNYSDYTKDPRPDVAEGTITAGAADGPVFAGSPVVAGPAPEAITILQPIQRQATGFLEYAVEDGPFQRVDLEEAGMLPFAEHVLKFRLPALPPGKRVRYQCVARTIGWAKVRQFYHGEIRAGTWQRTAERSFRTANSDAETTRFAVWNDTHENSATLKALQRLTEEWSPDFWAWNGDQSNDVHFERDMAGQFLNPAGLAIADRWPMAYVRGNHDVRGPAAHSLPDFTGTPEDHFYYAFRSGPVAALVMDTGEDKPDDSEPFGGMAAFERMQRRQAQWLEKMAGEPWFEQAPHKILFCHIPLWFTRDIFPEHRRWECHHLCRELWLPGLLKAGVKLVISGHTHAHRWMPARAEQPIAQLIGGGPQPESATFIRASADRARLTLEMIRLGGQQLAQVSI